MSKIEVILLVPTKANGKQTKKIRCKGAVVRTEPVILKDVEQAHYNIGIFFTDISKKDQRAIEAYVNSGITDEAKIEIKS